MPYEPKKNLSPEEQFVNVLDSFLRDGISENEPLPEDDRRLFEEVKARVMRDWGARLLEREKSGGGKGRV